MAALMGERRPVTVLLVMHLRLYSDGIEKALREIDEIGTVETAPTCSAALAHLRRVGFDVVVLDVAGIDDIADAQHFARQAAPARVVALAVREHDHDVVAWAEHGAVGIVTREATFEDLLQAILAAAHGECFCSPRVAGALVRHVAELAAARQRAVPHAPLTLREREIATLLIHGLSNKEIAARLILGVSTVKNHVHNILGKVEARSRSEAVARLLAAGIQA
jgi:two-component system nitrate/nitrite response regulator NarL